MWAAMYPDAADSIICMASGAAVPVTGIAWHILGRKIIETDQHFHGGDYYDHRRVAARPAGRAHARAHDVPLRRDALQRKFGAPPRAATRASSRSTRTSSTRARSSPRSTTRTRTSACRRRWTRWISRSSTATLQAAFARWRGRTLLVSFDTDWLFLPPRASASPRPCDPSASPCITR